MSQIYICKSTANEEVRLVEVKAKSQRDMNEEEKKMTKDTDSLYDLRFYDI